jgi:hypothetical protein
MTVDRPAFTRAGVRAAYDRAEVVAVLAHVALA